MRVAETRAVNRALRKAYGIGICSVEELGSLAEHPQASRESKKRPPQPANGNYGGSKVRDRLCQLIRQHQLVAHLADWAQKDRNALLCRLNSYLPAKEGAA
jgi:hypothetical protein